MAALRGLAALALVLAAAIAAIDLVRGVRGLPWTATSLEKVWLAVDSRGTAALQAALGPWLGGVFQGFLALPASGALFVLAVALFLVGRRRDRHQIPIMR